MPYRYLPDIAIADIAFEATGESLEELFISAVDATTNVMVNDLSTIGRVVELEVSLSQKELDLLRFDFLQELVYYKDVKLLLLRVDTLSVSSGGEGYVLNARLYAEILDPQKHPLGADVKAVTLHQFDVTRTIRGWNATVVLDI